MRQRVETVILVAVACALCVLTAARVRIWGDERLLWMDAISSSPDKPRPWVNLGVQHELAGLDGLAADAYRTASVLSENPDRLREERLYGYALAEANLARLQAKRGDVRGAVSRLNQILTRGPVKSVEALKRWYEHQLPPP